MKILTLKPTDVSYYSDAGEWDESILGHHFHGDWHKSGARFTYLPVFGHIEDCGNHLKGVVIWDTQADVGNGWTSSLREKEINLGYKDVEKERDFLTQVVGLKQLSPNLYGMRIDWKFNGPKDDPHFGFYRHMDLVRVTLTLRNKNHASEFQGKPITGTHKLIKIHTEISSVVDIDIPPFKEYYRVQRRGNFSSEQYKEIEHLLGGIHKQERQ